MLFDKLAKYLAIVCSLILSGCIDEEVTIKVNSDGSGTVKIVHHCSRADEATQDAIRKRVTSPHFSSTLDKDKLLKHFFSPQFKLVSYKSDIDKLRREIVLEFRNINELLVPEQAKVLKLDGLDFKREGRCLTFSYPKQKSRLTKAKSHKQPKSRPRKTVTIINSETNEKINYIYEESPQGAPKWTADLNFPTAVFSREKISHLFRDYTIIKSKEPIIQSIAWKVNEGQFSRSNLQIEMIIPFPTKSGEKYLNWYNPTVTSGQFLPKGDVVLTGSFNKRGQFTDKFNRPWSDKFRYECQLKMPTEPVTRLENSSIRFSIDKSKKTTLKLFSELKKGSAVKVDGVTFTIDDLKEKQVKIKADRIGRLCKLKQKTKRGNYFTLEPDFGRSTSGTNEYLTFKLIGNIENSKLLVEAYTGVETVYLDVDLGEISLAPRQKKRERDWREAVRHELKRFLKVEIPPVTMEIFETKEKYENYFVTLSDDQILAALIEVYIFSNNKEIKNANQWIQSYAQDSLRNRKEFLKNNRKSITRVLFTLYKNSPDGNDSVKFFISNLGLIPNARTAALKQVSKGDLRFAGKHFITKPLTAKEAAIYKKAFDSLKREDWMKRGDVFELIMSAKNPDVKLARQVLLDDDAHEFTRPKALAFFKESDKKACVQYSYKLLNSKRDHLITLALQNIVFVGNQFPVQKFGKLLLEDSSRESVIDLLDTICGRTGEEGRVKQLKPLLPILEDLAECFDSDISDKAEKITKAVKSH